jgi:uncharacterized protein with von Willebrand factor type A (vWA) domain
LLESEAFDHLNKLRKKKEHYEQQSEMLKIKYNKAKHKFGREMLQSKLSLIKMKYAATKNPKRDMTLSITG